MGLSPAISQVFTIVIPVYNGEKFLSASLDSCLNQKTEIGFSILILDDGSSDNSPAIASDYAQRFHNIEFIQLPHHGLVSTLNKSLFITSSDYIVRHDSDDLMAPDRLQLQFDFLAHHPNCVVLGGQIEIFLDEFNNEKFRSNVYPTKDHEIREFFPFGNPFAGPTTTFCRRCAIRVGGYRSQMDGAEDYDLWIRMSRVGEVYNLPSTLTKYRRHENQVTRSQVSKVYRATLLTRLSAMLGTSRRKLNALEDHIHASAPGKSPKFYSYLIGILISLFRLLVREVKIGVYKV